MSDVATFARAYLAISEPSTPGDMPLGEPIEFEFNPKEFTLARTAEWKAKASKQAEMPEFIGTKPVSITLEMFFDASTGGSVQPKIDRLFSWLDPAAGSVDANKPSPPFVSFGWGHATYLPKAIVKSVSAKYTRFRADGTPIRAVATVTLEELKPVPPGQNPTSGSLEARAERRVGAGDSLASIAYQVLGSPTLWRVIAEANDIDDPARVKPGTRLLVPTGGSRPTGR